MKLQKIPRGLLELFRLRAGGEMPNDFSRGVMPVVDVANFYASDILIPATSAPTVGALAPELTETMTLTVALGLHSLGGSLTIGAAAATNMQFSWGIILPGFAGASYMGSQFVAQAPAGGVLRVASTFNRIILPGGTQLFVSVCGTAAGADHSLAIAGMLENYTAT